MKKISYLLISLLLFIAASCHDQLNRPPQDPVDEGDYWTEENHIKLYANKFYPYFFPGYNVGYSSDYAPLRSYYFNDDVTIDARLSPFESVVPGSRSPEDGKEDWVASYTGPQWYFVKIREINIMLQKTEAMVQERLLKEEAYNHWKGVGRFFKGLEYSRLVTTFGDMVYNDDVLDPDVTDPDIIYQDRLPRGEVMDKVYDDFKFAFQNVRADDGKLMVNKYVVASFIARAMLIEGSFQKYHFPNDSEAQARARKYFEFATEVGNFIIESKKYAISGDYKSLFTSVEDGSVAAESGINGLANHKGVIFYRQYSKSLNVLHAVASSSNLTEGQAYGANLSLIKSYICNDGKPWQNSTVADADKFDVKSLIKTRDSRFEATFHNKAHIKSVSLLYGTKFCHRKFIGVTTGDWSGALNYNSAPVMRYAEVLLAWLEAKAELAELGSTPVVQADIDRSINAIRGRDLAKDAVDAGVIKTNPLILANLPVDPSKDTDVSDLIWEIRRERRMEFVFEHSRIIDLRRWRKLEYMDNALHPEFKLGPWVDFPAELNSMLTAANIGKVRVIDASGAEISFDGNNAALMKGYYIIPSAEARVAFKHGDFSDESNRIYNSPIGQNEIDEYGRRGYKLTQSRGW